MPYTLAFQDRFRRVIENVFTRDSDGVVPFASIPDDVSTKITYQWTGKQFTKLLSAVMVGADLAFPEQADDIIFDLIKGVHLPPEVDPEGDCIEYLPSAPFIKFYPDSPYIAGDNKDGWWNEAWFQWSDFFSLFPDWADDWIGGAVGGLLEYQNTDVLCNIASLAYPTWSAFFDAGGVFPKIEIKFSGTGQINVSLLSFPLGGKAIIELDNEPNVLDILTGGVLDPAAFMVELNRDILSFPPQEYPLIVIPIEVTTPGAHTLYINFIPVVNDETTFLGFGGGLRSVEMCGFAEVGDVGIEQIFWDGCALKQIVSGVETTIVTAEEIQACLDIPSGGGGAVGIAADTHYVDIGSNETFSNTTYASGAAGNWTRQFAKSKALIGLKLFAQNSGGNDTFAKPIVLDVPGLASYNGINGTEERANGATAKTMVVWDVFEDLPTGINLSLRINRKVSAGTGTILQNSNVEWVVIEFDDFDELFVEDVRYLDGVLEKKIGGVWLDVVDIEALLAPIQAQAAAANTAAANAQATANNAVSVNSAQQTVLNNHESRIDSIEDIDIPQINTNIANHESRIDALEAAAGGGSWSGYKLGAITHTIASPVLGYSSILNSFDGGGSDMGWIPSGSNQVEIFSSNAMRFGACVHVRIGVQQLAGFAGNLFVSVNDEPFEALMLQSSTSGNNAFTWLNVTPRNDTAMKIVVRNVAGNANWRLTGVTYLCLVINPFTEALFT